MEAKCKAYQAFRKYYKRESIPINGSSSRKDVEDFFSRHDTGVLKPNLTGCGKGIQEIRLSDYASKEEAVSYILSHSNHVFEERIQQSDYMNRLHPQSVNTVRVYAIRRKEDICIWGAHLRIGQGSSFVDNAAAGGVIVSINSDGESWTNGMDEFGHNYHYHPDIRFVGWDIAHTKDGWIIVEANENGQFHGEQIPYHRGFYKEIQHLTHE